MFPLILGNLDFRLSASLSHIPFREILSADLANTVAFLSNLSLVLNFRKMTLKKSCLSERKH